MSLTSNSPRDPQNVRKSQKRGNIRKRSSMDARAPLVIECPHEMQRTALKFRQQGRTVGFVPTMGALHEGHLSLIRQARRIADIVVVSIFVNPLQFGVNEDLSRYPRTFDQDRALCSDERVDVIFLPEVAKMYPSDFQTRIQTGPLAQPLEGKLRPGHFAGMLTVVAKLFQIVQPSWAVFGEKDFQQLRLVEQMIQDLHLPIELLPGPIVRETDGLAMSSRNQYLSDGMRKKATVLYRALRAGQEAARAKSATRRHVVRATKNVLAGEPSFETQYVALVNPRTLLPLDAEETSGRLLIAGHLGKRRRVRLIDNVAVTFAS